MNQNPNSLNQSPLADTLRTILLLAIVALVGVLFISYYADGLKPSDDAQLVATSEKL